MQVLLYNWQFKKSIPLLQDLNIFIFNLTYKFAQ